MQNKVEKVLIGTVSNVILTLRLNKCEQFFTQMVKKCGIILSCDFLSFFEIINKCYSFRIQDSAAAITFPADQTTFIFFGILTPGAVHCFNCYFNSGV